MAADAGDRLLDADSLIGRSRLQSSLRLEEYQQRHASCFVLGQRTGVLVRAKAEQRESRRRQLRQRRATGDERQTPPTVPARKSRELGPPQFTQGQPSNTHGPASHKTRTTPLRVARGRRADLRGQFISRLPKKSSISDSFPLHPPRQNSSPPSLTRSAAWFLLIPFRDLATCIAKIQFFHPQVSKPIFSFLLHFAFRTKLAPRRCFCGRCNNVASVAILQKYGCASWLSPLSGLTMACEASRSFVRHETKKPLAILNASV
jgi:hypothetical protein